MDIEPAAAAAGKETAVSASIRRNDEEPERERPAEEGGAAQRPLPPPEDYVRRVRELHDVALAPEKEGLLSMDARVQTYRYLDENELAAVRRQKQAGEKK